MTTKFNQNYGDAVVLTGDVVATSTTAGDITFSNTVNGTGAGTEALTVNTAGATTFNGNVGGTQRLESLTTDLAGSTTLTAGVTSIQTSNGITLNDAVSSGAVTLDGGFGVGNVTANNVLNDFTGALSVTGANGSIVDANSILLGATKLSGTYAVTGITSAITQNAGIRVDGTMTTKSATGTTLTNTANNIAGLQATNTTSGNIAVTSLGDTAGNVFTVYGATNAAAAGSITLTNNEAVPAPVGTLATAANATIQTNGGNVVLIADQMNLSGVGTTITTANGNVDLQNFSTDLNIFVREPQGNNAVLEIGPSALGKINAGTGTITIGKGALTGSISVAEDVTMAAGTNMRLFNGPTKSINIGANVNVSPTGTLYINAGGLVAGSGQITADAVTITADGGVTLNANALAGTDNGGHNVERVSITNSTSGGNISFINANQQSTGTAYNVTNLTTGGSITLVENATTVPVANAADMNISVVRSRAGFISIRGAENMAVNVSGSLDSTGGGASPAGAGISILGDKISLAANSVTAGTSAGSVVTLSSTTAGRVIDIGGLVVDGTYVDYFGTPNGAAQLDLTTATLGAIVSAKGIQIGEAAHTGDIIRLRQLHHHRPQPDRAEQRPDRHWRKSRCCAQRDGQQRRHGAAVWPDHQRRYRRPDERQPGHHRIHRQRLADQRLRHGRDPGRGPADQGHHHQRRHTRPDREEHHAE